MQKFIVINVAKQAGLWVVFAITHLLLLPVNLAIGLTLWLFVTAEATAVWLVDGVPWWESMDRIEKLLPLPGYRWFFRRK